MRLLFQLSLILWLLLAGSPVQTEPEISEKDFKKIKAPHFEVHVERGAVQYSDYEIRKILRDTYRLTSQNMKLFTNRTLEVILYSEEAYRELVQAPHWSGGLFDGKIRIPIKQKGMELRKIIRHEFAHALVWEKTRGNCPIWLNEGIASLEEEGGRGSRPSQAHKQLLTEKETRQVNVLALQNSFGELGDTELIRRAYVKSESIVRFIIKRYSLYKIHRILDSLGEGMAIEDVLRKEIAIGLTALEKRWQKSL
jgi:hypothetical protein